MTQQQLFEIYRCADLMRRDMDTRIKVLRSVSGFDPELLPIWILGIILADLAQENWCQDRSRNQRAHMPTEEGRTRESAEIEILDLIDDWVTPLRYWAESRAKEWARQSTDYRGEPK